ncbi:MAG: transaldolase [Candidatus Marinimicrobia bacterium]|nr:transaldolase [Candidatus Neomarinimicrobiota bacterium]MCF7850200.1 transaldolase [Candidatus Neomarinimicrobiota bacterium]MCF7903758.1 transaldolase [Candidatus Neomarinimicrobiota bacterium]
MSIYIDSANIEEIKQALDLGWISGITTNPLLLAKEGTEVSALLKDLGHLTSGSVFYQLISETFKEMIEEADRALDILEDKLVVKLPPTDLGFKVCSQLSTRVSCCPTAIYSPAQALVASEAGAQFIAVYVNRATRLMVDGIQLLVDIADVLTNSPTDILAASIKSPDEAFQSIRAGAKHLTLPFDTLTQMSDHPLSQEAVDQFKRDGAGLEK